MPLSLRAVRPDFTRSACSLQIIIAELLKANQTVQRLDLARNQIGDAGACALAAMLVANSTIEYLNLESNNFGERGERRSTLDRALPACLVPDPRTPPLAVVSRPLTCAPSCLLLYSCEGVSRGGGKQLDIDVPESEGEPCHGLCA